jgi:hypothetical protein
MTATKNHILIFIALHCTVGSSELKEAFVGRTLANQTFHSYLKELMVEEKVGKAFDADGDIRYFLKERGKGVIRMIIDNKEFDEIIDAMTEKEAKQSLKEMIHANL